MAFILASENNATFLDALKGPYINSRFTFDSPILGDLRIVGARDSEIICVSNGYTNPNTNPETLTTRVHSFPRAAEFRAEPRNLGLPRNFEPRNLPRNCEPRNLPRNSSTRGKPRNFTFFTRTTIFSQKMTSK